jgi:ribosome-associated protein
MNLTELIKELRFISSRSGGSGGQNVNKVETAITALLDLGQTTRLSVAEKELIREKLKTRINAEGILSVRAQVHRTQWANREESIKVMVRLLKNALQKKKPRIATSVSAGAKEKRLQTKKRKAEIKSGRGRIRYTRDE